VQLDLYTEIIFSVLSVYQSANKGICNSDTRWKIKINAVRELPRLSVFCSVLNLVRNRIFGSSTAIFGSCSKNPSFVR
jgi:hypothetical protein